MKGRVAGIRIRTKGKDFTVLAADVPGYGSRPGEARQQQVATIVGWTERALPSRTAPIIAGDLNETNCGLRAGGQQYYLCGAEREGTLQWRRHIELHGTARMHDKGLTKIEARLHQC